ncbi:MAG: glycosyltransferase family A protein [Gammaproteobacteria bacterium]|nr:glycosyltransferase family A protein [Gammaproteobacteria bacterium]
MPLLPKVSVVLITYNHEKFIEEAIGSILNQDYKNFELIIIDDGSRDKTAEKIKVFNDPRIRYQYQENQGPSSAINAGLKAVHGSYIAIMSGDDIALPMRLSTQVNYLDHHPTISIVFSKVDIINETGVIFAKHPLAKLFNQFIDANMERHEMFRDLFFFGNKLNGVTPMFRHEAITKMGGFYTASLQLQDYLMWFDFLKHGEIGLLNQTLLQYRILNNSDNLSSKKNYKRIYFEQFAVFDKLLDNIDEGFFRETFKDDLLNKDFYGINAFNLEKAFVYMKHKEGLIKAIGLRNLFYLLQDEQFLAVYKHDYKKTLAEYYQLTNQAYINDENMLHPNMQFLLAFKRFLLRVIHYFFH